jgi:hypothetical protein
MYHSQIIIARIISLIKNKLDPNYDNLKNEGRRLTKDAHAALQCCGRFHQKSYQHRITKS